MHRGSSKQPRSDRRDEKDRYPVNDQGIVVSPDNIKRAREHREVKNVDGKWVRPEDTGEILSPAFFDEGQSSILLPQDAVFCRACLAACWAAWCQAESRQANCILQLQLVSHPRSSTYALLQCLFVFVLHAWAYSGCL